MKKFLKGSVLVLVATLMCFFSVQSRESYARPALEVIPGGYTIGLKLYLDGLLVVGLSDIETINGSRCPGKESGVQKGDRITKINGKEIEDVSHFCGEIQESGGKAVKLELKRGEEVKEVDITPALYKETQDFKIGVWVRDSTAGIGTVTYILDDGSFAALGHGISDVDTQTLVKVKEGKVTGSSICSVLKGKAGAPGDLRGIFNSESTGLVKENTPHGIFGKLDGEITGKPIPIALGDEVTPGKAVIYANVDEEKVEEYAVEIESISLFRRKNEKNMTVKIVDERLLQKTGGIVQGMSGSPIIQNGKLVGAITHVFVNDPTRGYGIFVENMLSEDEKTE